MNSAKETSLSKEPGDGVSRGSLWTGRVITALLLVFLLFDAITKIMKVPQVMAASVQLGYPAETIAEIGIALLVCTLIYIIPQTAILGAILLTGYLGGAVASGIRIKSPLFNVLFPFVFAVLIWVSLVLREKRLRALIPRRTH
jgi:hypothetical protein